MCIDQEPYYPIHRSKNGEPLTNTLERTIERLHAELVTIGEWHFPVWSTRAKNEELIGILEWILERLEKE